MAQENRVGPDRDKVVSVWNGKINIRFCVSGCGPNLVYFHPAGGLYWDELLDALSNNFTVYAPELPGTTPGDPYAIYQIDAYSDLLLVYEEAIRKLNLAGAVAVGQSMGGMIAFDLAAIYPELFSHLVALAPVGLWREDAPVRLAELYIASPDEVPAMLFAHPDEPSAAAMFALPEDATDIPSHVAQRVWNLGCAGKFLWPIPDHGLRNRLHRITTPSLIMWGREDQLVPWSYADEFAAGIPGCEVKLYPDCGHILQMEATEQVLADVLAFVAND